MPLPPIVASRIAVQEGGCWLWTGDSRGRTGLHGKKFGRYGRLYYSGRMWFAHRLVYELLVGPIPPGLQLDHLCRVSLCVNPAHLEPVTDQENRRRALPYREMFTPEQITEHRRRRGSV